MTYIYVFRRLDTGDIRVETKESLARQGLDIGDFQPREWALQVLRLP